MKTSATMAMTASATFGTHPEMAARWLKVPMTATGDAPSGTTLTVNWCASAGPVMWLATDR